MLRLVLRLVALSLTRDCKHCYSFLGPYINSCVPLSLTRDLLSLTCFPSRFP